MKTFVKSEYEEIVKAFDYSDRMVPGDSLTSSTWEVGNGLTGANAVYDSDGSEIELSGGTVGNQYLVTNKVATTNGEKYQRSFYILVRDR